MIRVFINKLGAHLAYDWSTLFHEGKYIINTSRQLEDCDLLVLHGADSDVYPPLYRSKVLPECGHTDAEQDYFAMSLFHRAIAVGIPVVGICKGMQQLHVFHGGALIQHLKDAENHGGDHDVAPTLYMPPIVADRTPYHTQGNHHQGICRDLADGLEVWATSGDYLPEQVYYRNSNCAGFQWHPEWTADPKATAVFHKTVDYLMHRRGI